MDDENLDADGTAEQPAETPPSAGDAEPTELPPNHVRIGGQVVRLGPPADLTSCVEMAYAVSQNPARGFAACLAVCWQGRRRPTVKFAACGYNPLVFGGRVLAELLERGIDVGDITAAGRQAQDMLLEKVAGVTAGAGEAAAF